MNRKLSNVGLVIGVIVWVSLIMYTFIMSMVLLMDFKNGPMITLTYCMLFLLAALPFAIVLVRTKCFESLVH